MNWLDNTAQTIRGAIKATVFLAMVAILVPIALIYKRIKPHDCFRLPMLFHRVLLKLLGIKLRIHGVPSTAAPVFFVANHTSYLDIPILGALLPASFVAKSEVSAWPLFGFLARLQNTLFIERRSTRAAAQRTQLQDHLAHRKSLILFPEGTSSDGLRCLPFKSSLFSIVEESVHDIAVTVQPVSATCIALDGFPLMREERPLYAWYGDMTLSPHLWAVFKRSGFTIDVIFHEPLSPDAFSNRKMLATACQEMVARGIEQSLAGSIETPLLLNKER